MHLPAVKEYKITTSRMNTYTQTDLASKLSLAPKACV